MWNTLQKCVAKNSKAYPKKAQVDGRRYDRNIYFFVWSGPFIRTLWEIQCLPFVGLFSFNFFIFYILAFLPFHQFICWIVNLFRYLWGSKQILDAQQQVFPRCASLSMSPGRVQSFLMRPNITITSKRPLGWNKSCNY